MANDESNTSKRGFGAMDPEQEKQAGSQDRHAAHEKGSANELDAEKSQKAGQEAEKPVNNNKNGKNEKRGREDWGGYKGY